VAEERLNDASSHAEKLVDIAAVTVFALTLYTTLDRSDRVVEVCLEFLRWARSLVRASDKRRRTT